MINQTKKHLGPNPRHLTRTLEERFWEKVDKDGPIPEHQPHLGRCWVWSGSRNEHGYGGIGIGSRLAKAHRVSYELNIGAIPRGKLVLHRCDNPPCVNPGHLYIGTFKDNSRDSIARGRHRIAHKRGEEQWQSKLTEDKVREIRRRCSCRSPENKKVAEEMGISMYTIGDILRGKTWKHVEQEGT